MENHRFSLEKSIFRSKLDLSLVRIERERGEGVLVRMRFLSVGEEKIVSGT